MHFMFSFSLEKVLEAITTAGEWRAIERFSPIAQGLRDRSVQLQVSAKYMCSHWNLIELVVSLIFFSEKKYGMAVGSWPFQHITNTLCLFLYHTFFNLYFFSKSKLRVKYAKSHSACSWLTVNCFWSKLLLCIGVAVLSVLPKVHFRDHTTTVK